MLARRARRAEQFVRTRGPFVDRGTTSPYARKRRRCNCCSITRWRTGSRASSVSARRPSSAEGVTPSTCRRCCSTRSDAPRSASALRHTRQHCLQTPQEIIQFLLEVLWRSASGRLRIGGGGREQVSHEAIDPGRPEIEKSRNNDVRSTDFVWRRLGCFDNRAHSFFSDLRTGQHSIRCRSLVRQSICIPGCADDRRRA
jgi:hypothetical protein